MNAVIPAIKRWRSALVLVGATAAVAALAAVSAGAATPRFTAIDLGTLGGSASTASGINRIGQVFGESQTASGGGDPFLWTKAHGMVDLGSFGGNGSATR